MFPTTFLKTQRTTYILQAQKRMFVVRRLVGSVPLHSGGAFLLTLSACIRLRRNARFDQFATSVTAICVFFLSQHDALYHLPLHTCQPYSFTTFIRIFCKQKTYGVDLRDVGVINACASERTKKR